MESDDGAFSIPVRVYLEDTDAQGVVYNAGYFRFMERARTEWLQARGIGHRLLEEQYGIALVLTETTAKFLAPAVQGDDLAVSARVTVFRGARVVFEQTVRREADNEILCAGTAEVACKRIGSGRPTRWPETLAKELTS